MKCTTCRNNAAGHRAPTRRKNPVSGILAADGSASKTRGMWAIFFKAQRGLNGLDEGHRRFKARLLWHRRELVECEHAGSERSTLFFGGGGQVIPGKLPLAL